MKRFVYAVAVLFLSAFAAWADPSGNYTFEGTDLDGKTYKGDLQIVKSGEVFELTYTFEDGTVQEGSAVGDDTFLAYGYADDEELGVGLMNAKDGGKWEGIWTHLGASKMSIETWAKK